MDLITTQENAATNLPQLEIEIKFYLGQTAQNIIEVGKRLIQAKSLVQHGEWQDWLKNNFQLTDRTARNFIQCAERFGKTEIDFRFSSTQMIALLSLPDAEETEKFIAEKAAEGKAVADMTIKQLREEIADYKEQNDLLRKQAAQDKQQSLFDLQKQADSFNAQIGDLKKRLDEKPKVIETVVEKLPDDYAETKSDLVFTQHELSAAQSELSETRGQIDNLQAELDAANKKIDKLAKEKKRSEEIQKQLEAIKERGIEKPNELFDVIVIDPPWGYVREAHHGSFDANGRRCTNPYPEMTQAELKAIDLPAAENCVLFLWTTHKFIWDAKELLDTWRFDYRCMLVWNKQLMGTGNLFRMQCEFCLIALKGKPIFNDVHNLRDIIEEPRREHSRKPEEFYRMVDTLCTGRKLDYFSREQRKGWTTYGNDTEKF